MTVRLSSIDGTTLAFETPYSPGLVAEFKSSVPPPMRRWDGANKRWLVDAAYAALCADMAYRHFGTRPAVPAGVAAAAPAVETRLLRLLYLARCKDRGGDPYASGYTDTGRDVLFSEKALRDWFEPLPTPPNEAPTLYARLSVRPTDDDATIKAAWRRLARVWHPDTCREPDAAETFIALKDAYDVLSDPLKRRRYDAGLAFEQQAREQLRQPRSRHNDPFLAAVRGSFNNAGYRAPLFCGYVLAEGSARLGQFVVSRIVAWEDVTDAQGRTMVSSWPAGAEKFEVRWV